MLRRLQHSREGWKIPLFYLALLVFNFGIYIPWWGLYGDDWQYLYSYHLFGATGYPAFVAADRPFSAWVYMLFTPILGEQIWAYHILLLLLRWLAGILLFQVVQAVWPRRAELAFWAGAVLIIYPGFRQEPLPLEFILHFTVLNLTLFSLYCMLAAQGTGPQAKRWQYTLPGVVSALGIFSVEYFTGLELLRPLLLWVRLRDSYPRWRERAWAVLRQWLPYLLVFLVFLFWRVFVFQFQHYKPSTGGITNPLKYLLVTGWKVFDSLWLALVKSWEININMQWGLPAAFFQLALLAAGFLALWWVIRKVYPHVPAAQSERFRDFYIYPGVALAAIFLAGPLFWILEIPIQPDFPWDRPLLSFLPGVAILLGAVAMRIFVPKYRSLTLAALCAVALIANFHNAMRFVDEWQGVRSYLTQLTNRVPQVEPGTILLTQNLPFVYYGENTFFPILNWTYQPENHTSQMRVRMFDLSIRQGEAVTQLERGDVVEQNYRSFAFSSNRERVIAYTYQPPACLHVLTPADTDYPRLPDWLKDLAFLSKPELIQVNAQNPASLPPVLGKPLTDTWCAVYASAELAQQKQDWAAVRALAGTAESKGLKPQVGYEYLPFIEAFSRSGEWEQVAQYLQLAQTNDPEDSAYLCSRWEKIARALGKQVPQSLTAVSCAQ